MIGFRRTRRAVLFALVAALLVVGIAHAATVTIDTFDEVRGSQFPTSPCGPNPTVVDMRDPPEVITGVCTLRSNSEVVTATTGVLGVERDLAVTATTGTYASLAVDEGGDNELSLDVDSECEGLAHIQWDGEDGDAYALDKDGLGGVDLSGEPNTNDGILLTVLNADHDASLTFSAYTDADYWSDMTIGIPGDNALNRMDIFFLFSGFTSRGSSGAVDWDDLGALVLEIDATIESDLDLIIDNIEANAVREYGDLPSGYGTTILEANHIPQTLRLGHNVDAESDYNASDYCTGDDNSDFDDEDGVTPTSLPWSRGSNGGELQVVVVGCASVGGCYVNGWIDWNSNNSFGDTVSGASEHVINNQNETTDGTKTYTFDTPTDFDAGYYYARFRICEGSTDCDSPTNSDTNVSNGEVEDYRWYWDPTAVKLTSFAAMPAAGSVLLTWETVTEHDNAGFNLYRSVSRDNVGQQLNGDLIFSQAPGEGQSASYAFVDPAARSGVAYYYTLEDVDLDGVRTPHGPIPFTLWRVYLPLVGR